MILSLLICVISPVQWEKWEVVSSQSVLSGNLEESGSNYGQEMDWWGNGIRQAGI